MAPTLIDYLARHTTPETGAVVLGLSEAAAAMAARLSGIGSQQVQEAEADAAFASRLAALDIRFLSSRIRDGVSKVSPNGSLAAAIDPLDAGDVAANAPPGTLFALYKVVSGEPDASFLRPGAGQSAAGFFVYGLRTTLVLTTGQGTALFILDRETGGFHCLAPELTIPRDANQFAVNVADYRHWEPPVRRFVDDCLAGADGPRARNFDMRWTGSLAADAQRILIRGGIYLAPHGTRQPHRLVHHCRPVALLVEQAGGQASNGVTQILDRAASALDATSPLIFGPPDEVARVAAYYDLPDSEASPLFGQRGLFRL